jgi:hypothetical protein
MIEIGNKGEKFGFADAVQKEHNSGRNLLDENKNQAA